METEDTMGIKELRYSGTVMWINETNEKGNIQYGDFTADQLQFITNRVRELESNGCGVEAGVETLGALDGKNP
jgi:hypothetical protein